ncbi:shieldin complex subunit 2 isoform X2 [Electrophorus electricus]|uniref:shieldin complex subunit 2 isoform X2 n=1 Tax=Electrophorus electricus TaxID=8005 RepID=UPI0015CFB60E|nr:shieldin complex subunit 2 isoform X2 [Electrophorus electricus]
MSRMKENTRMTNKPEIHVFWGAPHPASLSEDVSEERSSQWRTLELGWSQGRLSCKKKISETQRHSESDGDHPLNAHGTIDTDGAAKAVGQLSPVTVQEKQNFSGSHVSHRSMSEDEPTPSVPQSSLEKVTYPAQYDLCPGAVSEYLDGCFNPPPSGPQPEFVNSCLKPSSAMSVETEYLSIWTRSQGLLLRSRVLLQPETDSLRTPGSSQTPPKQTPSVSLGSPELYSPEVSPGNRGLGGTLQGSAEFFCGTLSQKHQEGGVILESTPNGILWSQASPPGHTEVPKGKKESEPIDGSPDTSIEVSPTPGSSKQAKLSPVKAKSQQGTAQRRTVPLYGPTTLLSRCKSHGVSYSILVAVVHPWHLKEITAKSGASAGSTVPLATVIVTDQSGVEMKVVLWRAAAFWALTVFPGDILLIRGLMVHVYKWRGERVLQSSYQSSLLNLGHVAQSHTLQAPQNVNIHTLRELCAHLHMKHPLLVDLPPRTAQDPHSIPFTRLCSLRPDTLTHALLRVRHVRTIAAWRDEVEGTSRTGRMLKAVLAVEQGDGSQGALVLWGAALSWLQLICGNKGAVWEFRLLLVRQDITSGLLELHSTPWSSCQALGLDEPRCREFYPLLKSAPSGASSFEIDLHTLLSQKYTGDVELRVKITAFQFQSTVSQDSVQPMDGETSLERILDVVSGDITFTGCGMCCAELDTDENGIYRPCYPCLPHTGVRRYYRPVVLTVREGESRISVYVPPSLVQKILLNTPPDQLNKSTGSVSEERFVQVVAKRIHSMLSTPRTTFHLTLHSHFQCDENGVPVMQNFLLLDFDSQEA